MRLSQVLAAALIASVAVGCGTTNKTVEEMTRDELPTMRWDHKSEAEDWTRATLSAIETTGVSLTSLVPADIDDYCPAYKDASQQDRAAFWSGLISALAKHESTWNPKAEGGGGLWIGLTQIAPGTARAYGCEARSVSDLKKGESNLSCAVKIMSSTVPRDGVVSQGMRGVAADWGPFHSSKKRDDMKTWTREQAYCQG